MGYLFSTEWPTKKALVSELSKNAIEFSVVGNHLWMAYEYQGKLYLNLCLLSKSKDSGWGYKSMDESMGPFYYDCPKKLLKLVPVACQSWRDEVAKMHEKNEKLKNIQIGDWVETSEPYRIPRKMQLVAILKGGLYSMVGANGERWNLRKKHIERVL